MPTRHSKQQNPEQEEYCRVEIGRLDVFEHLGDALLDLRHVLLILVLLARINHEGQSFEELRSLLRFLFATREQTAALRIRDTHDDVFEHGPVVAYKVVDDHFVVVKRLRVHVEVRAVEEGVEDFFFPGLARVRIRGQIHKELRGHVEVVLVRYQVGFQKRPNVAHEVVEEGHNEAILLVALVDNVQGLCQVLESEDRGDLKFVAWVVGKWSRGVSTSDTLTFMFEAIQFFWSPLKVDASTDPSPTPHRIQGK